MPNLLSKIVGLFARSAQPPVAAKKPRANLRLETLEARDVPSVTPTRHLALVRHRAHHVAVRMVRLGDKVSLNPQPLPPRAIQVGTVVRLGDKVSLNPQPLPPKAVQLNKYVDLKNKVSLNPQPLPPKAWLKVLHRLQLKHHGLAPRLASTVSVRVR